MIMSLLAIIGLSIAYHWVRPDATWIPTLCRMDETTCASIVFTDQARVFGLPNSVLGQLYYLIVLAGVALGAVEGALLYGLLVASTVTVGLALYLSYSLLFILRVPCTLCFTAHGLNVILCVLLWSRL